MDAEIIHNYDVARWHAHRMLAIHTGDKNDVKNWHFPWDRKKAYKIMTKEEQMEYQKKLFN